MSRTESQPGDPEAGTPRSQGRRRVGVDFLDLGVSQGGTPMVPEKKGRAGQMGFQPGDPEAGPLRFRGRGRAGLTFLGLGVS